MQMQMEHTKRRILHIEHENSSTVLKPLTYKKSCLSPGSDALKIKALSLTEIGDVCCIIGSISYGHCK